MLLQTQCLSSICPSVRLSICVSQQHCVKPGKDIVIHSSRDRRIVLVFSERNIHEIGTELPVTQALNTGVVVIRLK